MCDRKKVGSHHILLDLDFIEIYVNISYSEGAVNTKDII